MVNIRRSWRRFRAMWKEEGTEMARRVLWRKLLLLTRRYLLRQRVIRHYVPAIGASMYIDLTDSGFSRTIFYRGVHEPLTTQLVQQEVEPGMVVLDVGANMGYYVLLEARAVGEQGAVYALEPVPVTFQILQRNVALNHLPNVHLFQMALGSEDGEATMYIMEKLNWSHLAHDRWSSRRLQHMRVHTRATVQVPIRTLNTFLEEARIPRVNFLRMDVEGFEVDIIQGGLSALERLASEHPIKIFMEVHPFLAEDRTPFVEMVQNLYSIGLPVKYVAYRDAIVMERPTLLEVQHFLEATSFREAPHLLFTNEH